jgi:hypothetical protein
VAGGLESANASPLRDVPPAGETQEAARQLANREEPPTRALANRVLGEAAPGGSGVDAFSALTTATSLVTGLNEVDRGV